MSWVRIDDHFDEHPKLAKVGPIGWGVWLGMIAYCNRNLTDGFVPIDVAEGIGGRWRVRRQTEDGRMAVETIGISSGMSGTDMTTEWVIDLLVDAGLLEAVEDGYRLHDYLDYQPAKATIAHERSGSKARMQKSRERALALVAPDVAPQHDRNNADVAGELQGCSGAPNPNPNPKEEKKRTRNKPSADSNPEAVALLAELSEARKRVDSSARTLSPVPSNLKEISARLAEGATVDDIRHVIAVCEAECKADAKAFEWFNAATPFLPKSFAIKLARKASRAPPNEPRRDSEDMAELAKRMGL